MTAGRSVLRSEEHTSEPSHSQISYAVFCLKKKTLDGSPATLPPRTSSTSVSVPATAVLSPLSLHDALPISGCVHWRGKNLRSNWSRVEDDLSVDAPLWPIAVLLRDLPLALSE